MSKEPRIKKEENCTVTEILEVDNYQLHIKYDDGNEKSYKFKDARDALHFLTNNWKLLDNIEIKYLFDYVEYVSHLGIFTIMDFYYMLMLEVIITFLLNTHKPSYDDVRDNLDPTKIVINSYNNTGLVIYNKKLARAIREAHLYAVGNTWRKYNQRTSERMPKIEEVSFPFTDVVSPTNVELLYIVPFNRYTRLMKFVYQDGYIIVYDGGNNFYQVAKKNSCKLSTKVII